jgi:hypothetical protein
MALTEFQREICRILARQRLNSGESYVAGGSALNEVTRGSRISRDIDLFHDTREALAVTWESDRRAVHDAGYVVEVILERPAYVEAAPPRNSPPSRAAASEYPLPRAILMKGGGTAARRGSSFLAPAGAQ